MSNCNLSPECAAIVTKGSYIVSKEKEISREQVSMLRKHLIDVPEYITMARNEIRLFLVAACGEDSQCKARKASCHA